MKNRNANKFRARGIGRNLFECSSISFGCRAVLSSEGFGVELMSENVGHVLKGSGFDSW